MKIEDSQIKFTNGLSGIGIESGATDRLRIRAENTMEVLTNGNIRLYIADDFPQVSVIQADTFFEGGGGTPGGLCWLEHGQADIGRSTFQDLASPPPRGPRDIYYARNLRFGNGSTTAGLYGGGNGASQSMIADFFKINPVSNNRYFECLLDVSGLHKLQTDCDFWFNDQSQIYFFNSGTANIRRAGTATLVGGTVTIPNVTISNLTHVKLQRKTAGGTTGDLTYTKSVGVNFTINSDSASDTSEVEWMLFEVWNL